MRNLILIPLLLVMAGAGYYLYQDYTKTSTYSETQTKPSTVGLVLSAENNVRRQDPSPSAWEPVDSKGALFLGDSLRVGPSSLARLKMTDGTLVHLEDGSLIHFEKPTHINVKMGDVAALNSEAAFLYSTRGAEIHGDGVDLRVMTDSAGKSEITALRNKLVITDKNKKRVDLAQEETADLTDGVVFQTHKTPVFIKSPGPALKLQSNQPTTTQKFSWDVNDLSIKDDRLQISKNGLFTPDATTEIKTHGSASTAIGQGATFWRVAWTEKGQILHTETRQINLDSDGRLELAQPENGSKLDLRPETNQVIFAWSSALKNIKFFTAELSKTADFQKVISSQTTKTPTVTMKDLAPQEYFWRVKAFGEKNEELASSAVSSFNLVVKLPSQPELITPGAETSWDENAPIEFNWQKLEGATKYRLGVYKDAEQNNALESKTINGTSSSWKWPDSGPYYWSVKAINAKGVVIAQSEVRKFTIQLAAKEKTPTFEIINPKEQTEVARDLANPASAEAITFQWKTLRALPGPLTLMVSRDPEFKEATKQTNITKLSAPVKLNREGIYYWKLVSASPDGRLQEISQVATFTLKGKKKTLEGPPPPLLVEPASQKSIIGDKAKILSFTWHDAEGAVSYHLLVKKTDAKPSPLVILDKAGAGSPVMSGPLSLGDYSWTVSSIDAKGQEGVPSAPNTFTIARLGPASTPAPMGAPKVNPPVIR